MIRIGWRRTFLTALLLSGFLVSRVWAQETSRFFPSTGQTLDNQFGFLEFWDGHDGAALLGDPLTPIVFEANVPTQYFERGRLEQRGGTVAPGNLGRERTRWRTFPAAPARSERPDERIVASTGYALAGPFLSFWQAHDGELMFGAPISAPLWEPVAGANIRVQYFERARLEYYAALPAGSNVRISPLGREIALAKLLINPDAKAPVQVAENVEPDAQAAAFGQMAPPTPTPIPPTATPVPPTATPAPFVPTVKPVPAAPKPTAKPAAAAPKPTAKPAPVAPAGGKVIDVDLSRQQLVAFEDGAVVFSAPVATGKDGFETPTGTFDIYTKLPKQTMRGTIGDETWVVPNVPNVMYINGSVALHGAYWHNLFGSGVRLSHGCVNLPLDAAAWLYKWAPVGTTVVVHQ